jgi:hypothetical protein
MRNLQQELEADNGVFPESWKPKPGDSIVGTLLRYDTGPTSWGDRRIAVLKIEANESHGEYLCGVWLSHKVLVDQFKRLRPEPGELVGIKRLPDADKGYARYVVKVDRPEVKAMDWDAIGENGELDEAA